MRPVISVVVPMLNATGHVGVLMNSLLNQDFDQPWEIIAVDNGSDDSTADVVRSLLGSALPANLVHHDVIVVRSPRGYATPRNAGARAAAAPLLAFCDADGAVDEQWLKVIAGSLEWNPLVASRKFRTDDVAGRNAALARSEQNELSSILGFTFALTAGLGCTRDLFDALGGFDPYFDLGGEDADFSLRARIQLGVHPVMEREAVYWSKVPSGSRSSLSKGYRDGRSHVRLYQRHLGHHSEPPSGPSTTVHRLYRLLRQLLRSGRSTSHWRAEVAWQAGFLTGRAVWSVRLGVRYF